MAKVYTVDEIKKIVTPIAKQYGVKNVWLFGSYARGEADEKSDIDLRITRGDRVKSLITLGGMYVDFEEALGKPVDIITTESLADEINKLYNRDLRKNIKRDEVKLYETE